MSDRAILLAVLAAMLVISTHAPSAHGDWPQFRGTSARASAESGDAAAAWSTQQPQWKTPLPGRGASCPIAWQDRVFVTAYTGYGLNAEEPGAVEDLRLHVLAVDRSSGSVEWDRQLEGSPHTQEATHRVVDHGFASSTPVTDGTCVYAFFGVSGVVCYDWHGHLRWRADVGQRTAGFGSAASPVVWQDLLLVNASIESGALFAFDKHSGREVWRAEGIQQSWSMPVVATLADGSHELVMNQKNTVLGLDPATGQTLWTCEGIDDYIVPVPVVHEDVVFCLGGRSNRSLAIRLGGRGDVTESHLLWKTPVGANVTSPLYYDGHLYWASDKGIACCIDAADGSTVYRERMPTRERVYASVVRAGSHLLAATRDQGLLRWPAAPAYAAPEILSLPGETLPLNAAPAVCGSQLLLRTDAYLYSFVP